MQENYKDRIMGILETPQISPLTFNFDTMIARPLNTLIHPQDGWDIYELAHSLKYSSRLSYKLKCIDQIMKSRGFVKIGAGTNRVIYRFLEDNTILLKISFDRIALQDNIGEFKNQHLLKPFVPKTFEIHPSGSLALSERVRPIKRMAEFIEIGDDIFDIITNVFIGKYVLEDIGTKYFMNWGIRDGFGPVLLDYPYCYELDGKKLYCNEIDETTGQPCNGVIDYDDGFNKLICPKCGKHYLAKNLENSIKNNSIVVNDSYFIDACLCRGNQSISSKRMNTSNTIVRKKKKVDRDDEFSVVLSGGRFGNVSSSNK